MFVTVAKYNRERTRAFELGRADGVRASIAAIDALVASGALSREETALAEMITRELSKSADWFEGRAPDGDTYVESAPLPEFGQ